jgi:hypothetical protein
MYTLPDGYLGILLFMLMEASGTIEAVVVISQTTQHYVTENSSPVDSVIIILFLLPSRDRLCGLVVRVLGYRASGSVRFPALPKKKVVGLERGPLTLVSTTEELLDRKVAATV